MTFLEYIIFIKFYKQLEHKIFFMATAIKLRDHSFANNRRAIDILTSVEGIVSSPNSN